MIKYFEVEGYKNFKNIVSLDFSDVRDYKFNSNCVKDKKLNNIIIYGKNAVGKTNLGTALMDIKDNFVRIPNFLILDQNYINADSNKKEARFKYIFEIDNNEIVYEYKKGEDARLTLETLEINQNHIFTYNHISKKKNLGNIELINASTLNWETLENNVSILNYIVNNIPLDESNILKKLYEFISGMSFISGNNLLENKNNIYIEDIIEKNQVKELERFLNKFDINEKLELKTLPTGKKEIYLQHKKSIDFITSISSGTKALVKLFIWLRNIEKLAFLYIDEFDAFYHYELSEKIIKMLENINNCQTVTTTHNTSLLSNRIMRPDCFFILNTERLTSIVNSTDRELREGHNLEKLYRSGEFDG